MIEEFDYMDRKVRIIGRTHDSAGIVFSVIIDRIEHYPGTEFNVSWAEAKLKGADYARNLIDLVSN
ncbi:hypothetical protein LG198_12030 [Methylobacillus arboreus]|uniref:hypothetical protein n=1 Tax=Methylobacillus arboreus TaxID=755170 RepID=UPI001E4A7E95|nr:hypothetical protein [Methylobacillus arboreus]MCB5191457.1 hypothetical protein [Methylobacillus arboreus]